MNPARSLVVAVLMGLTLAHGVCAQGPLPGQIEYENQCGVCHGPRGKGDGPLAGALKSAPPDLSVLMQVHNGVYPEQILRDIVDGRKPLAAHGGREMPIWGKRLTDQARFQLGPKSTKAQIEAAVQKTVADLVGYIRTLQETP